MSKVVTKTKACRGNSWAVGVRWCIVENKKRLNLDAKQQGVWLVYLSIHFYLRLLIGLDPLVDSVTSGVDHSNDSKGAQEYIQDARLGVRVSLVMEHGWEDICQWDTYTTFRTMTDS